MRHAIAPSAASAAFAALLVAAMRAAIAAAGGASAAVDKIALTAATRTFAPFVHTVPEGTAAMRSSRLR